MCIHCLGHCYAPTPRFQEEPVLPFTSQNVHSLEFQYSAEIITNGNKVFTTVKEHNNSVKTHYTFRKYSHTVT
jgi:hypothetical protein